MGIDGYLIAQGHLTEEEFVDAVGDEKEMSDLRWTWARWINSHGSKILELCQQKRGAFPVTVCEVKAWNQ